MGGSHPIATPLPFSGNMIDTTSNHHNSGMGLGVDGEYIEKMARTGHGKHKHNKSDVYHLPKNVPDSDEDGSHENTSEDDNGEADQDVFIGRTDKNINIDEFNNSFINMAISNQQKLIERFSHLVDLISAGKGLKARSPIRNSRQNFHNQTPFERNNLTVTTPIGSGGYVYVNNVQQEEASSNLKDSEIQNIISEFVSFFNELSQDDQEQFFRNFVAQEQYSQTSSSQNTVFKTKNEFQTQLPDSQLINSPVMSPNNPADLYDSSYETGSPYSSVAPSPGSPCYLMSPHPTRHSLSSESDQEVESAIGMHPAKKITNVIVASAAPITYRVNHPSHIFPPKPEPQVKPLGEPILRQTESATKRLYKLSNVSVKHFSIQLVCVIMKTKKEKASERFNDFSNSLMSLMRQKVGNKQSEIDIWQLAIYAHIQFLVAAERVKEYGPALLGDGKEQSLLYMAALQHNDKPLIARYIAESMKQVGYNPQEIIDEKENTLLHAVAREGDTHCKVLGELVQATMNGKPLFSLNATNKEGRTPLHVAVLSSKPHITTVVFLLQEGANPLTKDAWNLTPLHYHVQQVCKSQTSHDLALLKKMLNHSVPSSEGESLTLDFLRTDPNIQPIILSIIEKELSSLKKNEKH